MGRNVKHGMVFTFRAQPNAHLVPFNKSDLDNGPCLLALATDRHIFGFSSVVFPITSTSWSSMADRVNRNRAATCPRNYELVYISIHTATGSSAEKATI